MVRRFPVAALMSTSALLLLLPGTSVGQTDQQSREPCTILMSYLEENRGYDFPITLEEAQALQEEQDQQACRTSIEEINASIESQPEQDQQQAQSGDATDGADIVVEQRPPSIVVDQAAPKVSVQQPQPQVSVSQGQPEIIVRQPAPTVTVDIPQPEITVRMPEPDVQVSQAQPEVQVEQQQPDVRVVQPEEPQVDVKSAEAEVMLQQREQQQASVQVEQGGEPNIRYEREEPRVQVNQPEGEPQIRIEQAGRRDQREGGETEQQAQLQQDQQQETAPDTAAALSPQQFAERAAVSNRFEIEASNVAAERAQAAEVKDFAQRMVEDHTQAGENLQQAVQEADAEITLPDALDQRHQEMLDRLQAAEGADFDRQYVEMQVQAHDQAVQLFSSFAETGEGAGLQQFATDTLPTLEEHQQWIREISQRTEVSGAERADQQAAAQPEAQQPAEGEPAAGASAQQGLAGISVENLLGTTIYGRDDEELGNVGDVLFDQNGEIEAVIVDVGGFLGIGEKPVALRIDELDIQGQEGDQLIVRLNATREELENLPAYEEQ
jgi:predicted outer membrane protein/sporulation protein YlmC with PRC-barrel domain